MVKHMNFSYESIMCMPIHERRVYLGHWQEEMSEEKKQYDKANKRRR